MENYDAIVIGAGQGGSPLAHKLADLGQKVALIEEQWLGGSCINYGCTPTKAMIASARVAHYARTGRPLGVHTSGVRVELAEVVARKNEIVLQMRGGQEEKATSRPTLSWIRGRARFSAPHTLEVNGDEVTSERIFINTGTRPRIPPLPGLDGLPYLTNRNIMDVTEMPKHLIVLGGNYIGLEFAQMFRRFGCRVTVIELNGQITPREDADIAEALQDALEDEGISILTGARVTSVGGTTRGSIDLQVTNAEGGTGTMLCSHLLVATGQVPNSDDLGLDKAGVETDQSGWIKTNGRLETNVPGIWAIGDVKGGPAFTHISYDDHLVIYENLFEGEHRSIDGRILPYALYTDPELGRVGMSENEARATGHRIKVGSIPMNWVARAIERSETRGLMKVVINADNDRLLGAAILGPEGGELVQNLMTLMLADQPWTLFEKRMFIHPTLTEGFFALMDSVKEV
jgi:pyruvate/2-oxoglutarate dehydrogenase complex dihydrolipoamide dehydrogenase (E3) component